jgi:hypothetical protein
MKKDGYKSLAALLAVMNGRDGFVIPDEQWGGRHSRKYEGFMASPAINPSVLPPISTVSRNEFIATMTVNTTTPNQAMTLPTQGGLIPNDRFLSGIVLEFTGRMTNPSSGNPTGVQADAPFSLFDTIIVEGQHLLRGTREQFVYARGADLREQAGLYMSRFPTFTNLVNGTAGALSVTASATNDIRFFLPIWFYPLGVPAAQQAYYLLDAPNYSNLKLTINFGDQTSVFTGGSPLTVAFHAFGSTSGSPQIRVHGIFAQAGPNAFKGYVPGRTFTTYQENVTDPLTTATSVRLFNLPTGFHVRSLMSKTGVKSTAVTGGLSVYNTLSDTILNALKIQRGFNKNVRIWDDYYNAKEDAAMAYALYPDTGYALLDFAQHGTVKEAMDATQLVSGATGDVAFNLVADVTGAANQAALLLQQELRYEPQLFGSL